VQYDDRVSNVQREPPVAGGRRARERPTLEERYRILFVVGKGGMGAVECALERGAGGFERIVALKRMLPDTQDDARHTEMFLREARLGALLAHPNVVRAYDFGELRGELFLAMEYVAGQPLSKIVRAVTDRGERLAPALVAYLLAEACEGLHAAHELCDVSGQPLNVVHRDISPHNVMVSYDGQVKLLDFGVAKMDRDANTTKTGEVKGKMAYMSPEQALGDPLDRRSDLFAIGAILYECLVGRKMWGDGTDLDVMRKLALESPPKLDEQRPDAPTELCALYTRLTSKDVAARPASAREVEEALRRYLADVGERPGPDDLRALMGAVFGAEAEADRTRLGRALEEAAPAQADELRTSVTSASGRPPPDEPAPPSGTATQVASPATAAADARSSAVAPAAAGRGRAVAIGLVLALAAFIGVRGLWTASSGPSAAPAATAATGVAPVASASSSPPPSSLPTAATASAVASASPPASAPRVVASAPAPSARPPALVAASAKPTSAAPVASTAASPVVTAPATSTTAKPPDVDPTPF